MGLLWYFVSYILRFCINLLIEPQINPIKHFPVVTVSHKLLLPLIPHLAGVIHSRMEIEKAWSWTLASTVIGCIPGIFGFLVWELKENWRLYAANRKKSLGPVIVGKHGETMSACFGPACTREHCRSSSPGCAGPNARPAAAANGSRCASICSALHRFEVVIRRYVERDFLTLLADAHWLDSVPLVLREIRLASNRIQIVLGRSDAPNRDLTIALEARSGRLAGGISPPDWTCGLPLHLQLALDMAIDGLQKTSGVELLHGQVESLFSPPVAAWDLDQNGLRVWPDAAFETEVRDDLADDPPFVPQVAAGDLHRLLPTLLPAQIFFRESEITWRNGWNGGRVIITCSTAALGGGVDFAASCTAEGGCATSPPQRFAIPHNQGPIRMCGSYDTIKSSS